MMLTVPPGRTARSDCASVPAPPSSTTWSTPSPPASSRARRPQSGSAAVVDRRRRAASSCAPAELLVAARGDDHAGPEQPGELQCEERDAAGTEHQHRVARARPALRRPGRSRRSPRRRAGRPLRHRSGSRARARRPRPTASSPAAACHRVGRRASRAAARGSVRRRSTLEQRSGRPGRRRRRASTPAPTATTVPTPSGARHERQSLPRIVAAADHQPVAVVDGSGAQAQLQLARARALRARSARRSCSRPNASRSSQAFMSRLLARHAPARGASRSSSSRARSGARSPGAQPMSRPRPPWRGMTWKWTWIDRLVRLPRRCSAARCSRWRRWLRAPRGRSAGARDRAPPPLGRELVQLRGPLLRNHQRVARRRAGRCRGRRARARPRTRDDTGSRRQDAVEDGGAHGVDLRAGERRPAPGRSAGIRIASARPR